MAGMSWVLLVRTGLTLLSAWAVCNSSTWAMAQLRCALTYAGATQHVLVHPLADPYAAPSVEVAGRFRFKAVLVASSAEVERVSLYVYQQAARQSVIIQQAKYLPPFAWPSDGSPVPLTGQQHLYAGPMEREFIYNCQLERAQP